MRPLDQAIGDAWRRRGALRQAHEGQGQGAHPATRPHWLARYPFVAALLQRDDDELLYDPLVSALDPGDIALEDLSDADPCTAPSL
jgi:hypothetical protein